MKLLHCADFHLDFPFRARNAEEAQKRRMLLREVFSDIIQTAIAEEVSLLLIAGDLWENDYVSHETAEFVLQTLQKLPASCSVVIAPGDHDPYGPNSPYYRLNFPENVYIFSEPSLRYFDFPKLDARVYGYAFTDSEYSDAPLAEFSLTGEDLPKYSILCAHGDTSRPDSSKAPITRQELLDSSLGYAALGHRHSFTRLHEVGNTRYAYCGSPDALGFEDCGARSYLLIDWQNDENGTQFDWELRSASLRHCEVLHLDVTGAKNSADAQAMAQNAIAHHRYTEHTALKMILQGQVFSSFDFFPRAFADAFSQLLTLEVVNETLPFADDLALRQDIGIRGSFYRQLLPDLESGDEVRRRQAVLALQLGLLALDGKELPLDASPK